VFPVDAHGKTCATSGLELVFAVNATEAATQWPRSQLPTDVSACLHDGRFVLHLPPASSVAADLDFRIHVRLAMHLVNLTAPWAHLGPHLDDCLPVPVLRASVCAEDPTRFCGAGCQACLSDFPLATVTVVENALDNPVLDVASFGYALGALSFAGLRWRVTLHFDPNFFGDAARPFVFLSRKAHVLAGVQALPCELGERNVDGTCCVQELAARLWLPAELEAEVRAVRVAWNGSCPAAAWVQENGTVALDGTFGNFSYAETHPLQPGRVTVTLAYDDVVRHAAVVTYADDAEHVQFFLGLGVLRVEQGVLQATAPPLHLYSKVTPHYYFTSQVQSGFACCWFLLVVLSCWFSPLVCRIRRD